MQHDVLGIYLNDHLAGATVGADLARHLAHRHRHSARASLLERIADEIAQDRQSLLAIMDGLGVPAHRYKVVAGWAAERLRRLKPNGILQRHAGLDTVMELETLRLGVEGKSLLWLTLLAQAEKRTALDTAQLNRLLDRARTQLDTVEGLRRTAAAAVF
ncbi:hypothetical protein [Streptomyces sp. WP-1]|uniref:hypothetical protein n=1 Tax=Streptomyces sp. WP-1 TaxID=3041497 RepID=UPI002648AB90|nr:hypothetical protein [Streptomyces sp. WP-1]WKE73511.1 hypothetical protein QHG49_33190 [Streptomyces sp. WP-1]